MKNSKLNEIVGYPLVAEDVDPEALLNYLKSEGFNLQEITKNKFAVRVLRVSHDLFHDPRSLKIVTVIRFPFFPLAKTIDYYDRIKEVVEFAGDYELLKRYLNKIQL